MEAKWFLEQEEHKVAVGLLLPLVEHTEAGM
jgi:hypothetical protein